ncbi:response regulator transcription factor [Cellulomonas sp. Leaf334]|uniref:response regulator transcription factor n=1 Tax=Cellulomonas sp. Leaf334 TaxID=1736339 RepID=UPI0006FE657D|nr:response regulator transcription factor [Cellulomonas sp. Leaf334]KQR10473.1 two-component system response regulator [Cellulomonas sp. Leaf334]
MANVSGGPTTAPGGAAGTTVLVVEDEPAIAQAIVHRLSAEGWTVEAVGDGLAGVSAASRLRPDVVVLDVMLPGIDGLEVCRRIQAERPVPVLMLTARDDETDMLIGLGVGADDYMTKPFSMRELVARTKALLRRTERATRAAEMASAEQPDPPLVLGDVTVDRAQRRVLRGATEVHLTPTEFDLLLALAATPRTVLTRERLLAEVWDWVDASGTRTVDSHIKALRRKLGPDLIRTVHGVGYAFEPSDGTTGADGPSGASVPEGA